MGGKESQTGGDIEGVRYITNICSIRRHRQDDTERGKQVVTKTRSRRNYVRQQEINKSDDLS